MQPSHAPIHEEALARLRFLVDRRRRVGLLLGQPAASKSSVLEAFGRELARAGHAVALANLRGVCPGELFWQLAVGLGANPTAGETVSRVWRRLTDRLAENRHQQRTTVILLDDVDHASAAVISHIVRLAQHSPLGDARHTLLLAADGRRVANLGERLVELAALRVELDALHAARLRESA